jgi:hypothetical protein
VPLPKNTNRKDELLEAATRAACAISSISMEACGAPVTQNIDGFERIGKDRFGGKAVEATGHPGLASTAYPV